MRLVDVSHKIHWGIFREPEEPDVGKEIRCLSHEPAKNVYNQFPGGQTLIAFANYILAGEKKLCFTLDESRLLQVGIIAKLGRRTVTQRTFWNTTECNAVPGSRARETPSPQKRC